MNEVAYTGYQFPFFKMSRWQTRHKSKVLLIYISGEGFSHNTSGSHAGKHIMHGRFAEAKHTTVKLRVRTCSG